LFGNIAYKRPSAIKSERQQFKNNLGVAKIQTQALSLTRPRSIHHINKGPNPFRETMPLKPLGKAPPRVPRSSPFKATNSGQN